MPKQGPRSSDRIGAVATKDDLGYGVYASSGSIGILGASSGNGPNGTPQYGVFGLAHPQLSGNAWHHDHQRSATDDVTTPL
jgi:hypothetical protein